jgi:hypothetical protein
MKKLLLVLTMVLSIVIMSGCSEDIYIEPNTISVIFENPHFVGESFYIDVYITNGYNSDEFVAYMEFDIYTDDDSIYVAGAGFDIDETIPADDYVSIELEFSSEFVFVTEEDLNNSGYDLERLELYFWIEE